MIIARKMPRSYLAIFQLLRRLVVTSTDPEGPLRPSNGSEIEPGRLHIDLLVE